MTEGLYSKLSACRCNADAAPILETVRASSSQKKLVETGIALMQNQDLKQRQIGEDFLRTAVHEMEDGLSSTHEPANVGDGEKDVKKLTEEEVPSGTGTSGSEQSSKITQPYPSEGTDEPNSDIESMQSASGENQMGKISELGGMPMPGAPQGLDPVVAAQMAPQMPQMPQMNTPQMLKQMQYTVQEALKPVIAEIKNHRQGITALDKQIREIQTNRGSMTLDIENVKAGSQSGIIRETTEQVIPGTDIPVPARSFPGMKLHETRNTILEMDAQMNKQ